jgi:putative addiction module component (TIGR02574 family)
LPERATTPIVERMSIAAEKIAEVLALPQADRAYLAHRLLSSLDDTVDTDADAQWQEVIERRSREMAEGQVDARSEDEMVGNIRDKLNARRQTS